MRLVFTAARSRDTRWLCSDLGSVLGDTTLVGVLGGYEIVWVS